MLCTLNNKNKRMKKEYKLKTSKFADESRALVPVGPSAAMLEMFKKNVEAASVLDEMERRNMPRLIKAVDRNGENIPVGGMVCAVLVDVIPSPVSTVKGSLLWLHLVTFKGKVPVATGQEITFPATGVIRQALAPEANEEDRNIRQDHARQDMLKLKGRLLIMTRQPDGIDRNLKKTMTTWDVFVSPKPVDIGIKIH